jgi:hypothetical protein
VRLAACCLVLSLLALAAPAHAETWSSRDRRADVVGYDTSPPTVDDDCGPPPRQVRSDARRDLLRLSVDHTATDVVVTLSMRAVARRDRDTVYDVYLRTPDGVHSVSVVPGLGEDDPSLFEIPTLPQPDPGAKCQSIGLLLLGGGCDGLGFDRDPVADTVTYTVPRDCLGRPSWVRVGAQIYGFRSDDEGRSDRWGRQRTADVTFPPPFGPRVRSS